MRLSLRRLFLHFTLVCLVLGAIAAFPDAVETVLRWVGGSLYTAAIVLRFVISATLLVGPAAAICAYFGKVSPRPKTTLALATLSAITGCFFSPALLANGQTLVLWTHGLNLPWQPLRIVDAVPPAMGALITGVICQWNARHLVTTDGAHRA